MSQVFEGVLRKMHAACDQQGQVNYSFRLSGTDYAMGAWLGKRLVLTFSGDIQCIHCGRSTTKSFNQGYCFPCFNSLAQCDRCIMSPELCHFDAGTCREPEWAADYCMTDHLVYLSNASGLKVGITRINQIPTRWIDQGAVAAIPLYRVASRKLSGLVEVAAKAFVADKTNWRAMLRNEQPILDLLNEAQTLQNQLRPDIDALHARFGLQAVQAVTRAQVSSFRYPVLAHPDKVSTHNPDKNPCVEGVLQGVKGQYLILDSGVINMRKFTGYQVQLRVED